MIETMVADGDYVNIVLDGQAHYVCNISKSDQERISRLKTGDTMDVVCSYEGSPGLRIRFGILKDLKEGK